MRTKMISNNVFTVTEDRSTDPCEICEGPLGSRSVFIFLPGSKLEVDICTGCAKEIGRAARALAREWPEAELRVVRVR